MDEGYCRCVPSPNWACQHDTYLSAADVRLGPQSAVLGSPRAPPAGLARFQHLDVRPDKLGCTGGQGGQIPLCGRAAQKKKPLSKPGLKESLGMKSRRL